MSVIKVNNITNLDGTSGPVIAGVSTVLSTSHFVVPVGNTFKRNVTENIVENGLVLYLDAGTSTSYPGTGTTLIDLSGNNNTGTLVNGPTYSSANGGSIVFDGSNDYINVLDYPILDIDGDKTLSCWIYMGGDIDGCAIAGKISNSVNGMALAYGWNSNGFQAIAWNNNNSPQLAKDLTRDINKWVYITALQSGSTRSIYAWDVLGLRSASSVGGTHTWNNNLGFAIGAMPDGSFPSPSNTKISTTQIYNRALSAAEISQNFNATRSRYGI